MLLTPNLFLVWWWTIPSIVSMIHSVNFSLCFPIRDRKQFHPNRILQWHQYVDLIECLSIHSYNIWNTILKILIPTQSIKRSKNDVYSLKMIATTYYHCYCKGDDKWPRQGGVIRSLTLRCKRLSKKDYPLMCLSKKTTKKDYHTSSFEIQKKDYITKKDYRKRL